MPKVRPEDWEPLNEPMDDLCVLHDQRMKPCERCRTPFCTDCRMRPPASSGQSGWCGDCIAEHEYAAMYHDEVFGGDY